MPQGFAERYLQYADNATATQPTIDTVVSYASGAGSLAQLKVNEFLSLTRTTYLGMPQAQRTLDAAMVTTLDAATADMKQSHIAVVSSDSEDDGTTPLIGIRGHAQNRLVSTVAGHAGMHVPRGQHIQRQRNPPQALLVPRASGVVGSAANADMRDVRSAGMCCVYRGDIPVDGAGRSVLYRPECVNVGLSFVSLMVYTLMAIACGFLLGSSGFNEMATNGFVNVFALLVMFTSGMAFPVDMMPDPMIIIGKLLPGWWLCSSIDHVFGLGTASSSGVDYGAWASSTGLVAMFAVAFICLGLALGRIRRARPTLASPATTQLAK